MRGMLLAAVLVIFLPGVTRAQSESARPIAGVRLPSSLPEITHLSKELGIGASFASGAGATRGQAVLRIGTFARGPQGIANAEFEFGYSRSESAKVLDAGVALGVLSNPGGGTTYPYLNGSGGVRKVWSGGGSHVAWPAGVAVGVRFLTGRRSLFRVEYRFRRVFHDPVADYNEQDLMCGISLLIGSDS